MVQMLLVPLPTTLGSQSVAVEPGAAVDHRHDRPCYPPPHPDSLEWGCLAESHPKTPAPKEAGMNNEVSCAVVGVAGS